MVGVVGLTQTRPELSPLTSPVLLLSSYREVIGLVKRREEVGNTQVVGVGSVSRSSVGFYPKASGQGFTVPVLHVLEITELPSRGINVVNGG